MQPMSRRLGELLVERNVLSREALFALLEREQTEGVPLTRLILQEGLVAEGDLMAAVAHEAGFGFVDLRLTPPAPSVEALLPEEVARERLAVAVDIEGDRLVVAMVDPSDAAAVRAVEAASGFPVRPVLATRSDLVRVIDALYGQGPGVVPGASDQGDASRGERAGSPSGAAGSPSGASPPGTPASERAASGSRGPRPAGRAGAALEEVDLELHVNELLEQVVRRGGSDLHLTVGIHPTVRIDGRMTPMTEYPVLNGSEIRRMVYAILTQKQRERFEADHELDTSHAVPGVGRFRLNVFLQRDTVGAVMRAIPYEVVPFGQLGLPEVVAGFAELPRGLVLVTGPTGSGKTTTLASVVDLINERRPVHIVTIEDPIEFMHFHKRAVVNQREVGEDTASFAAALKHVLRQDPDVILVGEMRDLETIATALTAAETGHLVFGTLHTQDAPQSIDRVIDVFPAEQQRQIRVQLASALQGIVTQQLLPSASGKGRVVAAEVLVATPAVRNLIREGKTHQVYSAMQAGGKYGMQTMDMALAALVRAGKVTMADALDRCVNADDLRRLVNPAA
jgi:twitching motility protein PilT